LLKLSAQSSAVFRLWGVIFNRVAYPHCPDAKVPMSENVGSSAPQLKTVLSSR
jgi:hypothetical protein